MASAGKVAAAVLALASTLDVAVLSTRGFVRSGFRYIGIVLPYLDNAKEGLDYLRILGSGDWAERAIQKAACAAFNASVVPSFSDSQWAIRIRENLPDEISSWDRTFVNEKVNGAATALSLAQRNLPLARAYVRDCLL